MIDKEIRISILENLKRIYDKNPNESVELKDLKTEEISDIEIIRNIKYLDEKNLIDTEWFLDGDFFVKINSFGIDFLEYYSEDLTDDQIKEKLIPSLINESIDYTDKKLALLNPDILKKLEFIYSDLMDDKRNHPHNFARIAFDCREILMDFTDTIFKDEYLEKDLEKPKRNQTKNKIKYTLKKLCKSETESNLISERYEYLINYFSILSDFIQKNSHPAGYDVTLEDAKSCLIYTYLFMRDVLKILDFYNIDDLNTD
jgi:hypothetical protein